MSTLLIDEQIRMLAKQLKIPTFANYNELIGGYKISLSFDYQNEKMVNYILNDSTIITKKYDQEIYYEVLVNKDTLDKLKQYNPLILQETYIEK